MHNPKTPAELIKEAKDITAKSKKVEVNKGLRAGVEAEFYVFLIEAEAQIEHWNRVHDASSDDEKKGLNKVMNDVNTLEEKVKDLRNDLSNKGIIDLTEKEEKLRAAEKEIRRRAVEKKGGLVPPPPARAKGGVAVAHVQDLRAHRARADSERGRPLPKVPSADAHKPFVPQHAAKRPPRDPNKPLPKFPGVQPPGGPMVPHRESDARRRSESRDQKERRDIPPPPPPRAGRGRGGSGSRG